MKTSVLVLMSLTVMLMFVGCSSTRTAPTKTVDYTIVPQKTCK